MAMLDNHRETIASTGIGMNSIMEQEEEYTMNKV
jgi:hypothetical protein